MSSFVPTNYFIQRWAKEQLQGTDIDPNCPPVLLQQSHGWDATHLLLHNRDEMPADRVDWWKDAITRLLNHGPRSIYCWAGPILWTNF